MSSCVRLSFKLCKSDGTFNFCIFYSYDIGIRQWKFFCEIKSQAEELSENGFRLWVKGDKDLIKEKGATFFKNDYLTKTSQAGKLLMLL